MGADPRPDDHAVTAHFADAASLDAALEELAHNRLVDVDAVTSGTGEGFATELEPGDDEDTGAAGRVLQWLTSLGQEREELVRLGQAAREGRHAVVINDVADEADLDGIVTVLKRHGAADIVYFGDWQTEDLSIER